MDEKDVSTSHSEIYERIHEVNQKVHGMEVNMEKRLGHIGVAIESIKTTQEFIKYIVVTGLVGGFLTYVADRVFG